MQQLLLLAHLHLLGIIKDYVICYEIQQHGPRHAHVILWVVENNIENITNKIVAFILTTFNEFFFIQPKYQIQTHFTKL
jgi:hypothetical protein